MEVVVRAPDLLAGAARERGVDRAAGGREAPLGAAHEAAPLVGLVELEATRSSSRTGPASSRGPRRTARRRSRTDASSAACPTRPDELARPSGCRALADRSSSRGVPIAFAASTTTLRRLEVLARRRGRSTSRRSRGPASFVSMRRTRAPVISRAPMAIAFGQWVRSVDAFAPSLQPCWQVPRWTHGRRPSYGGGQDRVGLRPPVPAEPGRAPGRPSARPAPIGSGGSGGSSPPGG